MKGYNEVVMLRRLTERHKQHALWLLTKDRSKENDMKFYDGLYQLPHDDGLVSTLTPLLSPMFFPSVDLTASFFREYNTGREACLAKQRVHRRLQTNGVSA